MGPRDRDQGKLFYEFKLDDMVPKDHLLRRMDVFVTSALGDLHAQLKPFYSEIASSRATSVATVASPQSSR